jgi:hypothetical protein
MSRLSRSQSGPVRAWAPPESPLRIEYSPALLREIRIAGAVIDAFGVLYGIRHGQTVRLVSTRGRAGLDPLGVFASRVRGPVFLTEEDLERFEKAQASVALVISGDNGGFFVRDAQGSIETVRSYEEFSIRNAPAAPLPIAVKKKPRWQWAACLPLVLMPAFYFPPHKQPPALALNLLDDYGQLHISWNVPANAKLTIIDGGHQTIIPIKREESSATDARRTGDVTVRIGTTQMRFVGPPLPSTEVEQTRAKIERLKSEIASLRAAQDAEKIRIASLQSRLQW